MKRYLVFTFDSYYPRGGWHDFKGDYDSIEKALERASERKEDFYQIVDSFTKSVERGDA